MVPSLKMHTQFKKNFARSFLWGDVQLLLHAAERKQIAKGHLSDVGDL